MIATLTDSRTKIETLVEQANEQRGLKHDYQLEASQISFDYYGNVVVPAGLYNSSMSLKPTPWMLRQLFTKLGPTVFGKGSTKSLPFDYLTAIPSEMMADALNVHLQDTPDRNWLLRGYDDTARALLGDGYVPIDNSDVVKTIGDVIHDQGMEYSLVRSWVSPDQLCLRVVVKGLNTPAGHYGVGFYVENGEIGNKRFSLMPFVQRTSCTNSTIWNHESGMEFVHVGSAAIVKKVLVKAKIVDVLGGSMELLDRIVTAESERIPSFDSVIAGFASKYGWSADTTRAVEVGTEGRSTRAALIHGVTYAAHASLQDPAEQVEMEKLGGAILDMPQGLFAEAARRAMAEVR